VSSDLTAGLAEMSSYTAWFMIGIYIYTSLFTKMVVKRRKRKNTYIQKYTTNRNGSKNKE